jgi:hypothetical protein
VLWAAAGIVAHDIGGIVDQQSTALRHAVAQESKGAEIDWDRARGLFQRAQQGEKLSPDDAAYLEKAKAARKQKAGLAKKSPGASRALPAGDSTGLKPLTEMTAADKYLGEEGGLYGQGSNVPPASHQQAAAGESAKIQPLNADGRPDPNGTIGLISISMSNATQEFSFFKGLADADSEKSRRVKIVDCAQGGQAMAEWVDPQAPPWQTADRRLDAAGVAASQVQVAWIKLANKGPTGDLQQHGRKLQRDTMAVVQNAKARFPNLRVVYLGSRIYGGYSQGPLNPEPYAYESAFAARWLIQDQIKGEPALNYDAGRGEVKSALLLWGPYLWADGVKPRQADGLAYTRQDLGPDGTHPSQSGREKVATMLLNFLKKDPLARKWFLESPAP